jgi:RNA polymerase sigma-70 factor (ECF subfamily)
MERTRMAADEKLMSDYAAGDLRAFEVLFARWGPRLHAFFLRSFRSRPDADDLLQALFLRVHRARASFRPEAALRSWLFAIAVRLRQDELRRRRRLPPTADEEALANAEVGVEPQADPVEQRECAALVRAALEGLPESQRVIIHLHRYEQMTFAEIAAALGTTEGAVKLRAFRGYERLRKILAPLLEKDASAWA